MNIIQTTQLTAMALVISMSAAATAAAKEVRLTFASTYPQQALISQAAIEFSDLVKQKTDGEVAITMNFGGALGYSSRQQYDAIEEGALDVAQYSMDTLLGVEPIFSLHSLPFVSSDLDDTYRLYQRSIPQLAEAFERANQKLLLSAPWTPVGVWAKKEIQSVEDLRGLKIRTVDPVTTESFRKVGAMPVQLSWGDVLSSLSTGVIEALVTSDESGVVAKVWEFGINHFTALNSTTGVSAITINEDVFAKLGKDQQEALLAAAAEAEKSAWERSKKQVAHNHSVLRKHGGTVITDVPDAVVSALKEAGNPAIEKWKQELGKPANDILTNQ